MRIKNLGFTLIELLVVVLIIGILVAVALPQYQMSVAKTRYAQMVSVVHSLVGSLDRYYLENGQYPDNRLYNGGMDMTYPASCTGQDTINQSECPDGLMFDILDGPSPTVSGKDPNYGVGYIEWGIYSVHPSARRCTAVAENALANKICKSLGGRLIHGEGYMWVTAGTSGINIYVLD